MILLNIPTPNYTNFDNEIYTTLVGFKILRSCYDQTGGWPSAFVMYLYGPYFYKARDHRT